MTRSPLPALSTPARRIMVTLAGIVAATVAATCMPAAPAHADQVRRKRPATTGMTLTAAKKVKAGTDRAASLPAPAWKAPSAPLPAAGAASVAPAATMRRAGSLPVRIGTLAAAPAGLRARAGRTAAAASAPASVTVTSQAPATAGAPSWRVSLATASPGSVALSLDVAWLGTAASRARLVRLPACAATTPDRPACQTGTEVPTAAVSRGQVTGVVPLAAGTTVMALTTGASGTGGDFAATSLGAASAWSAGGSSGDFTWSYPVRTVPAPAGTASGVGLAYSAASVDGRTVATNNQASWAGEGWDLSQGFIERRYTPCAEDMTGSNTAAKTGDLCWDQANATASFGTHSGELVQDGTSARWRLRNDDGTRFELLTGAANGDNDGEYWKVTAPDGTRYIFGQGVAGSEKTATNSTWTAPVFGNQPGEPCHATSFAASACSQAWRWNLDQVIDAHGNAMAAFYATESNRYGQNLNTKSAAYIRGGYLTRIVYGYREGAATTSAPARVEFTTADRCLDGAACGAPSTATASHWPDVPVDQICTSATSCPTLFAPTFFTTKRLARIASQMKTSSGYTDVDVYTLTHSFPDPGDGTAPALWLSRIDHSGAGGALPDGGTSFGGQALPNRVDGVEDTTGAVAAPFYKYRIVAVTEPGGGQTMVDYQTAQCTQASVASLKPESNTSRCFPTWWTPPGATAPVLTWFHRYPVARVAEHDTTDATTPDVETNYSYGAPGWRYDDSALTPAKYRTWSQFAGYASVATITGKPGQADSLKSETVYYRGLNGDRAGPTGGTRSASVSSTWDRPDTDDWWKAGTPRQTTTYNGISGPVVDQTVTTIGGLTTTVTNPAGRAAGYAPTTTTIDHTVLAAGGRRSHKTVETSDQYGNLTSVDDAGDVAKSGDELCTRATYATSASGPLSLPATTRTRATSCAGFEAASASQVIEDTRYYYDAQALGTAVKGDLSAAESLATVASDGAITRQVAARATYDGLGRPLTLTDPLGAVTTTSYTTDAATGLVTGTTTTSPDPDGAGPLKPHVTTTTLDPRFGTPTKTVEPGRETTETTYDALGRTTTTWLPGRSKATYPTSPSVSYTYQAGGVGTPAATTTSTLSTTGSRLVSTELFDGLGRSRQTQRQTIDRHIDADGNPIEAVGRLVSGIRYDSRGLASVESSGVLKSGAPTSSWVQVLDSEVDSQTVATFDGAGRQSAATLYSKQTKKWATTWSYGGDRVTVTPPAGSMPSTTVTDIRGRTVQKIAYKTSSTTGPAQTSAWTRTPAGQIASMTDPAGSVWRYTYDARGNQVKAVDPDAGTSTATFDAAGRKITATDAGGRTLAYTYDALGRATSLRDATPAGNLRAQWDWDTPMVGYLGSASRVLAGGARWVQATTARDAAGRPTATATTVPAVAGLIDARLAGTYAQSFVYYPNGMPRRTVLPGAGPLAAEELRYGYDAVDRHTVLLGNAAYVADAVLDADDRLAQIASGTSAGHLTWQTMDHDPATGRLARLRLDRENAAKADADISYRYTDSGLTRSISAAQPEAGAATDTQCFGHDFAGRLATAYSVASATCPASAPASPSGPAPYSLSWAYDAAGNRTRQDDQVSGTVTTWTYPAATGVRPHAPVSQTVAAPGATPVTTSFGYDAGGNTTGRVSGSVLAGTATGTVENQYDAENHLAAATNTNGGRSSAYAYDADGDRVATSIGGTQTVYLPGGTELSVSGGQVTATRIYTYQGAAIARRTATTGANRLAWQWTDGAGSDWQVDAATTPAPLIRRADPFGGLRGPQPGGWSGARGMAAGITDTVAGTLRLGARDYDPVTGAFTQPDPIIDVTDPAQWNPYSYGAGNPVDRPDPSGLAFCSSTVCGGGTTGSMNETGGSLHETHRPTSSSGGGGSRSGGGGSGRGGSRYHGGGYNGGGHRAYRYTTPRRAPARHAVSKARYKAPARPAAVTPLPPPPNPYLLCLGCVPFGAIAQGAALGAVEGVAFYLIVQLILGEPITGNGILTSAGIGMIFGAAAPFIGRWLGRFLRGSESEFKNLQYAEKYRIKPYKEQRGHTKGTGGDLQAHHLIEKRFVRAMGGGNTDEWPTIVVTRAEHQKFTNAWRKEIPYGPGTSNATREDVENAARKIYADYPEILEKLGLK
ncbi:RHS repeat-associated core domain-containing protein [Acidipropionibacterium virtanenii]|nr:RHS repeat-associated core domain-containing protein [Acidipropionibacterium virtanenii]